MNSILKEKIDICLSLHLLVEYNIGPVRVKLIRVTELINVVITSTTMKPGLLNVMRHQVITTGTKIILLSGPLTLLIQNKISTNTTRHYLVAWTNKTRVFMNRQHGYVNVSSLPRVLKRFPWGGDHITPYGAPLLIKFIQPIIQPAIFPVCVICSKYILDY